MAQHKWHKEIKAWADGAEIEKRVIGYHPEGYYWVKEDNPNWNDDDAKYRIKPQPKESQYLYVYAYKDGVVDLFTKTQMCWDGKKPIGKIKLEEGLE